MSTVVSIDRGIYLLALLAPLAFLPLLAPRDLVGAVPALAQNLLASDPVLFHHRTQYQAFVIPFLMLAAIGAYGRLARRPAGRRAATALVVAGIASLALASRTVNDFAVARWWPKPDQRAAYAVLARVPPTASVSAQDPYVPHVSQRSLVFVFPVGIERADHVLINAASYPWRNLPGVAMARDGATVTIAMPDGQRYRFEIAAEAGPHWLLRRP